MSTYQISQLAERTGVPATTLRFYESTGLLPAERSPAGYRLYGEPAVERLGFITTAKRLGLSLAEIATLIPVWETSACARVKTELRPRLWARLREADQRRRELTDFIGVLRSALDHLDALPDRSSRCDPDCGFPAHPTADPAGDPTADPADDPTHDPTHDRNHDRSHDTGRAEARDAGRDRWRDAPVACSLTSDGIDDRAEHWRSALAGATRIPIPGGLELTLPLQRLATVAELAAAEHACCPFFDFRLHLDGPHLHLQVRAGTEGRHILADLFDHPTDPTAL
jgi:MerR family transcriptional regulator, copper efflux regulator